MTACVFEENLDGIFEIINFPQLHPTFGTNCSVICHLSQLFRRLENISSPTFPLLYAYNGSGHPGCSYQSHHTIHITRSSAAPIGLSISCIVRETCYPIRACQMLRYLGTWCKHSTQLCGLSIAIIFLYSNTKCTI